MRSVLFASAVVVAGLHAQAKTAEVITVTDAKLFAPMKGTPATAAYVVFTNSSDKDVTLSVSKAAPFKAVEMHQTLEKDGKMSMEKVEKLVVPAKGTLELKQGGNHIMLFEASREVKAGETVKITFKQDDKNKDFEFKVVPRVEAAASGEHHHHH